MDHLATFEMNVAVFLTVNSGQWSVLSDQFHVLLKSGAHELGFPFPPRLADDLSLDEGRRTIPYN